MEVATNLILEEITEELAIPSNKGKMKRKEKHNNNKCKISVNFNNNKCKIMIVKWKLIMEG